jgi:hypothetical protein
MMAATSGARDFPLALVFYLEISHKSAHRCVLFQMETHFLRSKFFTGL